MSQLNKSKFVFENEECLDIDILIYAYQIFPFTRFSAALVLTLHGKRWLGHQFRVHMIYGYLKIGNN